MDLQSLKEQILTAKKWIFKVDFAPLHDGFLVISCSDCEDRFSAFLVAVHKRRLQSGEGPVRIFFLQGVFSDADVRTFW